MANEPVGSTFGFISVEHSLAEIRTISFWRDVLVEIVICIILSFVGLCVSTTFDPDDPPSTFMVAFASGLYVFVLIEAFAHIQYAVMNPIIAVSFIATKRISFIKGFVYAIVEIASCAAGAMLAKSCAPEEVQSRMTALGPGPGVTEWQAFVVEMIMSMSIVIVALGALDFDRRSVFMAGLPVGMGISIHMMSGRNLSGGCTNPAIAMGLAVTANDFSHLWVYFSGDFVGAFMGMTIYFLATYDEGKFSKDFHLGLSKSKNQEEKLKGKQEQMNGVCAWTCENGVDNGNYIHSSEYLDGPEVLAMKTIFTTNSIKL